MADETSLPQNFGEVAVTDPAKPAEPKKQETEVSPQKTSKPITFTKALALSLCLSIMTSAGSVVVYDHFFAQKLAVLDMEGFLTSQKKLLAAGKITGPELIKSLDRVEVVLDKVSPNTVVILKDVVLRNASSELVP